ncbi:MAG TPA: hypothetical protein VKT25_05875 [Ktedonobacteraceae bacterium]|nr:hypothetical protein [Ktedonobacteraceae bacterium]
MPEITLRLASEQDIDALIDLYEEFHAFHVRGVPDRLRIPVAGEVNDELERSEARKSLNALLQNDTTAVFAALVEGQIVGLVEVSVRQDNVHPLTVAYRYGYLQSLFV